ncbi:L,D-transpeptidase family protein [Flavihumibacter sp. UBA7668]|uniref:L,D-transpeptidase family protein n=1 Tax=Flavihumibacter sp. UBA7668 TaxID=1946542 RepID=UPI0025C686BD|nr:L,D-transpeptidase family protein [Flavihumibacter sp. UBA7668]
MNRRQRYLTGFGRNLIFTIFSSFFLLLGSCKENSATGQAVIQRDTAISGANSFSTLFFDSVALENYLTSVSIPDTARQLVRNFYNQRNFHFAWFDTSGVAEQTLHFWNLQSGYLELSRDSSIFNPYLQAWADSVQLNGMRAVPDTARQRVEWALTLQFLRYASQAYMGNRELEAQDLNWFIPRKRVDILSLLDTLVKEKGKDFDRYEPVNRQYGLLREQLKRYYEIERLSSWTPLVMNEKKVQRGDTGAAIIQLKNKLSLLGDLPVADSGNRFDESLELAVKRFQSRYGLKEDGVIGGSTLRELSLPINRRIRQILVNMERLRWVPEEPKSDYLLVNIPEFKLHVYEQGNYAHTMNVVVGTSTNSTVIFTGGLKYVVFSPYWNVPPGILKKEVLPGIARNPNYLASHNMEWFGNRQVRQKPGPKNSLGLVKFLFPNNYNIYLHDTPSKSLFKEDKRAFSHGCIRISDPEWLADWLLRSDSTWTQDSIFKAMNAGKEKYVTLKKEVPVFIGYFTAWVDREGRLNFRDDIYGHDAKMMKKMFQ